LVLVGRSRCAIFGASGEVVVDRDRVLGELPGELVCVAPADVVRGVPLVAISPRVRELGNVVEERAKAVPAVLQGHSLEAVLRESLVGAGLERGRVERSRAGASEHEPFGTPAAETMLE
jgi:hypothetical protein